MSRGPRRHVAELQWLENMVDACLVCFLGGFVLLATGVGQLLWVALSWLGRLLGLLGGRKH